MTTSELTLTHNGTAYTAVPGRIERTFLGFHEHHLRMVAELGVSLPASGYINIGDYVLDENMPGDGNAVGTAFGMDFIMHVLRAAGSETWEGLKGSQVLVLFNADSAPWGRQAVGLARQDGSSHTIIFSELAAVWKSRD